ncbi:hypothetical protein QUB68_24395 [Microcoleus sp. A006_D1]|uniref:hypothetical protein n=1 Tax=Microcoleus sp. A006_D1 TaxID=3055267 RepID=UPI002FCEED3F
MRKANDFYPTESAVTKQLLKRVSIAGTVLEPCAGNGAIASVIDKHEGIDVVYTNDINPAWICHCHADATKPEIWRGWQEANQCDWVVTNPPFNQAALILPLAYEAATVGVAFLLRLSYLEPAGNRGEWLRSHKTKLTNLIILGQPRPSFTGNGKTDSCTVAWMVWRKEARTDTIIDFVTDWKQ